MRVQDTFSGHKFLKSGAERQLKSMDSDGYIHRMHIQDLGLALGTVIDKAYDCDVHRKIGAVAGICHDDRQGTLMIGKTNKGDFVIMAIHHTSGQGVRASGAGQIHLFTPTLGEIDPVKFKSFEQGAHKHISFGTKDTHLDVLRCFRAVPEKVDKVTGLPVQTLEKPPKGPPIYYETPSGLHRRVEAGDASLPI